MGNEYWGGSLASFSSESSVAPFGFNWAETEDAPTVFAALTSYSDKVRQNRQRQTFFSERKSSKSAKEMFGIIRLAYVQARSEWLLHGRLLNSSSIGAMATGVLSMSYFR